MIPEMETLYATDEAKLKNVDSIKHRDSSRDPDDDGAPVTAWQRYQQFVSLMEANGGKIDRKMMLEAMFRGRDITYTGKC